VKNFKSNFSSEGISDPQQFRWKPMQVETGETFIDGIKSMCGAGDPAMKDGLGIHTYGCDTSMDKQAFYSADGDMLIVP
jgi:homogentisate 1,2-dioxygenase